MLAFNRKKKKKYETYPCYIQPKLDGLRAMWRDGALYSRDGIRYEESILPHIFKALSRVSVPLDGELYCHGMRLGQINSRAGINRKTAHKEHLKIGFHVYDYVSPQPFSERQRILYDGFGHNPDHITYVETMLCDSANDATKMFKLYRSQGFEGAMLRNSASPYGLPADCGNKENRWHYLLKYKDWSDLEALVVGFNPGKLGGEWADTLGSFKLAMTDGTTFDAGTGIDRIQRDYIWANQDEFMNTKVRVQYELIDKKPLKPVITCVYQYEE